ncbi:MAG: hypothetical protein WKF84_24025 [Pyrinomonadaceae bacterium]
MNPLNEQQLMMTRRHFFGLSSLGIGTAALVSLLTESGRATELPVLLPQGDDQKIEQPGVAAFRSKGKKSYLLVSSRRPFAARSV